VVQGEFCGALHGKLLKRGDFWRISLKHPINLLDNLIYWQDPRVRINRQITVCTLKLTLLGIK
jgi:hypothetical protein